jgi:uncharacterized protein YndB with AHSA1/START domain
MTTTEKTTIKVSANIDAPIAKVWELWTTPKHIMQWNNASDDWWTSRAENDLRTGGEFVSTMEAKDGSFKFDFAGVYREVIPHEKIHYAMADGREVKVYFRSADGQTQVTEVFDPENIHSLEMQEAGWQAILNNFKKYVEYTNKFQPIYFSEQINASKVKVWNTMMDEATYHEWVSSAWPNSFYEGIWKEGESLLFINKENSGTKAKLLFHRPYEISLAEHIAVISKGIEKEQDDSGWIGSKELYLFSEKNGVTTLEVIMYATPSWHEMFKHDWPIALKKLKEICER